MYDLWSRFVAPEVDVYSTTSLRASGQALASHLVERGRQPGAVFLGNRHAVGDQRRHWHPPPAGNFASVRRRRSRECAHEDVVELMLDQAVIELSSVDE